ncbi:hypothetical protein MIC448_730007 [Microbacterium sp. C448]|nr:hypothetical protein MIC448_730007 [Microbacterium sp. C448]
MPVPHREVHVGVRGRLQVTEERQRDVPQPHPLRLEGSEFEDAHADRVATVGRALERTPIAQLAHQAVRRAEAEGRSAAELAQREKQVILVETLEDGERTLRRRHALGACGPELADGHRRPSPGSYMRAKLPRTPAVRKVLHTVFRDPMPVFSAVFHRVKVAFRRVFERLQRTAHARVCATAVAARGDDSRQSTPATR